MSVKTLLTEDVIDTGPVELELNDETGGSGAIVTFQGVMRPLSQQGELLESLVLEWHPRLTTRSLQEIGSDGSARFGVNHIRIIHRCGSIAPDELIVFVAVMSTHRRESFLAADYIIDRLKTDAVFWKREVGQFGSRWIEPTERDNDDRRRWSEI